MGSMLAAVHSNKAVGMVIWSSLSRKHKARFKSKRVFVVAYNTDKAARTNKQPTL